MSASDAQDVNQAMLFLTGGNFELSPSGYHMFVLLATFRTSFSCKTPQLSQVSVSHPCIPDAINLEPHQMCAAQVQLSAPDADSIIIISLSLYDEAFEYCQDQS